MLTKDLFRGVVLLMLWFLMASPARTQSILRLAVAPGEHWYGGRIGEAHLFPFSAGYSADQLGDNAGNQVQPLLLSSHGRYVWCADPVRYSFTGDSLIVSSPVSGVITGRSGATLREAYAYVSKNFFPPTGAYPDDLLFAMPQYNTWIELIYDQNQRDVLAYAKNIVDHGFPPGVIMIDDNWQEAYGTWEFKRERFDDPKAMVDQLHEWGFKVMVWVCPFISADTEVFRKLRDEGLLLGDAAKGGEPAILRWWNGYSAHLDFTNPAAVRWFRDQLDHLQKAYGIDGFKLDAGDFNHYTQVELQTHRPVRHVNEHSEHYARIGLSYRLNEYRACWKLGGEALAQRLRDKDFSWPAARTLIPGILAQGLMGYPFACPDMIGGGEYRSFLSLEGIDQEMIVRSAQAHALMPMMQFSVAPWRVLDDRHREACKQMALLHQEFGGLILDLVRQAARTGEPIARYMEYEFPHQGFAAVTDQFMLGPDILVAPVLEAGKRSRQVLLPPGQWVDDTGRTFAGGLAVTVETPLERLPYFRRVR